MTSPGKHQLLVFLIAAIWIGNGLFCKVLGLVPRHQEIVASILGNNNARLFTVLIGLSELFMAVWILSGLRAKLNAITQILVIAVMNALEFFLVPDLLLWGKWNAVWAILLAFLIYYNAFLRSAKAQST